MSNNSPTAATVPPVQTAALTLAVLASAALAPAIAVHGTTRLGLFAVGIGFGVALWHASFGFTGAYRRAIVQGDLSGVAAQAVMIGLALVLFAPLLAAGWGRGALAPVSMSMAFGAFLFGIGMQLGSGCASGTLFTIGGGSARMVIVLAAFCAGAFAGSLHLGWWRSLPGVGAVSLGEVLGWPGAVAAQLAVLALALALFRRCGGTLRRPLWGGWQWRNAWRGPWPLLLGAVMLAALNALTLAVSGRPWSVTWGFTLWGAKAAAWLGWDPSGSTFWAGRQALVRPLLADTVSVINIGIVLGAFSAAALAGRFQAAFRIPVRSLAAAVLGGLLMGYGARLAYGCNIGALFSGIASGSLHGWVWIFAAIPGNILGVRLRPLFGLQN